MAPTVRRAPLIPLLGLALAACTSGDAAPEVVPPTPAGEAARACRELAPALPERLADQRRVSLDQETPYAAAWGDPAIVLRCGVKRPATLTPGSDAYDPGADAVEVNGVTWLMEEESGGYRFTTTEQAVFVEVWVPDDHAPEVNPLAGLAAPVKEHIPPDPLYMTP